MSNTALYEALTEAGASKESASAATDDLSNRLQRIEINVAELKITNRVMLGLVSALLLLMLKPILW